MIYTNYYVDHNILNDDLHWFKKNLLMEVITGSHLYGCQTEKSDYDFTAIVMPLHNMIYPQNYGYIIGFDDIPNWKRSDRKGPDKKITIDKKEVEGEWISLIEFFYLAAVKGSPPAIELLFAHQTLVTFNTDIGNILRDNRRKFLSQRHYHSFKGYAFSQLQRIKKGHISGKCDNADRQIYIDEFGYDIKMAYNSIRLIDYIDQILTVGDINLMRNKNEMKAMRAGEWGDFDKFEKYILQKLNDLEHLVVKSPLPYAPAVPVLHNLLQQCIESFYGSIDKYIVETKNDNDILTEINNKLDILLAK